MREYNAVLLRYCTGDTWTGTNTHGRPGRLGLYFSGHHALAAVVDALKANAGLGNASTVPLTGRVA